MDLLHVYADESCTTHRFLVLGGIVIERAEVDAMLSKLLAVRDLHRTYGEVKWTKLSKSKLKFYFDFVNVFFEETVKNNIHFFGLHVETSTFRHKQFNQGDAEIGFDKMIYQLLLHKFGRKFGGNYRLHVFLDKRDTKQQPDVMRPMLNHDLKKRGVTTAPFRRLEFLDSKDSDLIQLNDLLVGVVGFVKNERAKQDGCSPHKKSFSDHIVARAKEVEHPYELTSRHASHFSVWPFKFG